ncbi:MAG: hypothetical protein ACXWC9_08460 [Pseudobdellovibrionaceae bacterium]
MDLQRSNQLTASKILRKQNGFASTIFLSILPVLLAGLFFLLFSQYYLKNWMQSLHICRTELLETQSSVGKTLEKLMALNAEARALRVALQAAFAEFATGIATSNPALIAKANRDIAQIKRLQKKLDVIQKSYIWDSNAKMLSGIQKVARSLRSQDQWNQAHLPDLFSFRIHRIKTSPKVLAVKPDRPEIAPVYELQNDFTDQQSLNVSWTSEFQTRSKETIRWLSNHHHFKQSCSASLKEKGRSFPPTLSEDKPWSKL